MLCAEVGPDGVVRVAQSQPVDTFSCGVVVVSGEEQASIPWNLTLEQGALIGGAVLGVWAIAWVFRSLAKQLMSGDDNEVA